MKKYSLLLVVIFFVSISAVFSQGIRDEDSPVSRMDYAAREIAVSIHKKFTEEKAQKVIIGQISYRGTVPPFSAYWVNQLTGELTNIPNRTYTILSGASTGADWTITGEVVDVAGIIRVFTRLVRMEDRAIEGVFQSDFQRVGALIAMLSGGGGEGGSSLLPDEWEPDSFENPVTYEPGVDEDAPVMNRNLHTRGDEDFFLIVPESDGRLIMETTGSTDTYMEFYDAGTLERLAQNDDGGQGYNARIRYRVSAGYRYIAKVRGSSSTTGNYGFRAYLIVGDIPASSWDAPITYEPGVNENAPVMEREFNDDEEDFFLIVPENNGRLTMETTGSIDTFMEFYDAGTRERLAQDDDSGQGYNARIRYNVEAGKRYIVKIRDLNSEGGGYGFRAWFTVSEGPGSGWGNPITYEPGVDENAPVVNRTLERDGEDYFLLIPETDGRLIMETTGDMDTYMEFYDADTRRMLADDDDGGSRYNARIRYNVEAGKRYIAKVYEYERSGGRYGFRAYLQIQVRLVPDEFEPDDDPSQANWITVGTAQQHTFHNANDVDWVKFQVTRPGRHIIRARGVVSNRLDTYIELFDASLNLIAEDDDGGENMDSMLSLNLDGGLYYLKVWCLSEEPDQPYTIRIDTE